MKNKNEDFKLNKTMLRLSSSKSGCKMKTNTAPHNADDAFEDEIDIDKILFNVSEDPVVKRAAV